MKVAGIQIEKDRKGNPAYAHINLKKHGETFRPLLEKVGAIDEDGFDKRWKRRVSGETVIREVTKHIEKLFENGRKNGR